MDKEILKQGKFTTSGSSALKMMPKNLIPLLDLIVRESLQNSLDASLPNAKEVKVDFTFDTFKIEQLAEEFEFIKDKLLSIQDNSFLSVRDTNTCGLTGKLDGNFKVGEINQNLGKLVFHIMKKKEDEGAGGSWGVGKTVYYRFGIGFVIYYSRVKLENGTFQERLVGALVEDETNPNGILSAFEDNIGVAFFGKTGENGVEAITDSEYIHRFLSIFNIAPFTNFETGTQIIIPFINPGSLLKNDSPHSAWYEKSITDYLAVSILRWYFPRMSIEYNYGPRLKAFVNGEIVKPDENAPVFKYLIELCDAAYSNKKTNKICIKTIERKTNLRYVELGRFAYIKLKKEDFNIKYLPDPYKFLLFDGSDEAGNTPIVGFCRKPGMNINFKMGDNTVKVDKGEIVLGMFVLNSTNEILDPQMKLEEYVRNGEGPDHLQWNDYYLDSNSGRKSIQIINMITKQIANELQRVFGPKEETEFGEEIVNMAFSQRFGRLFLADNQQYHLTKVKPKGNTRSIDMPVAFHNANKIDLKTIRYSSTGIVLNYFVCISVQNSNISFINCVETSDSIVSPIKWENDGFIYPCNINKILIQTVEVGGNKTIEPLLEISPDSQLHQYNNYFISFVFTETNKCYGIRFDNNECFQQIKFNMKIELQTNDKLVKTNFVCSMKEDKEQ